MYIYKITHIESGKAYIGQTVDVNERWSKHCTPSSGCLKLRNAIQKYGRDAFEFKVLFECEDQDANALEMQLIAWYGTFYTGYNMTIGGGSLGSGKNHPRFGKKPSEETRRKMSEAKKGKKNLFLSLKNKKQIGEKNPNAKLTDIQRQEIKELYVAGNLSYSKIAGMYNVHLTSIHRIIKGKTK